MRKAVPLLVPLLLALSATTALSEPRFVFSCAAGNDIYRVVSKAFPASRRFDTPSAACEYAPRGAAVFLFADGYPDRGVPFERGLLDAIRAKSLHVYIEYPSSLPGATLGKPRDATLERGVITGNEFGKSLPPLSLLYLHGCRFVPAVAERPYIALARVAGFDRAVFGLEGTESHPVLFGTADGPALVATTRLSGCIRSRFAPSDHWQAIWTWILRELQPGECIPPLKWEPSVGPSFSRDEPLPADAEQRVLRRGLDWFSRARLLVHPGWADIYDNEAGKWSDRVGPMPGSGRPSGDGSLGVLEGFSSRVNRDGTQQVRWWRRHDCNAEVAGAMALAGKALDGESYTRIAGNICDWLIGVSVMSGGERADPGHPAYGLFGWNDVARYWEDMDGYGVYYGDDNARSMLGLIAAGASLDTDRWNDALVKCLLANLRTAGTLGFRRDRIDERPLEEKGWRAYFDEKTVSYSPHFQAYLWACWLWAYERTGYTLFRDRAENAIRMTMAAYPTEWHWTNGIQQERARMLLPLAWLVRVDDTPEHRKWLRFMAGELLAFQDGCGAIREEIGGGAGRYGPPKSNAEYGVTEAPLIQENGDPLSDMLYTTNFAFLGLHEAAAATGDPYYRDAGDRLAGFLCRIQVRSDDHPELDGAWFRAFDHKRWEHWASNSDAGWGVWSTETGWTQGWITSVLALRVMNTSLWEASSGIRLENTLEEHRKVMLPE